LLLVSSIDNFDNQFNTVKVAQWIKLIENAAETFIDENFFCTFINKF